MNWEVVVSGVIGLIAGNAAMFLFFPQTKNLKKIENESKQSEEWKKLYSEAKEQVDVKQEKIDKMYIEVKTQFARHIELQKENASLQVEIAGLKALKCTIPGCANRTPPTGF